uniref:TLC domain containing 2 n=1 Tax=Strix occidentalis caurina TaxID=311401 RepID=A0A8D0FSZ2_STROC
MLAVPPPQGPVDAHGFQGQGLLLVAGSFAAFRLLNRGLERLVPPPPSAWRNRWKWRNIWTSLAHSVLSGGGALGGGVPWHSPSWSPSLLMSSLIPGYFLEDFVDMLCHQKLHQSWELLFHHSVVIVCFGIAVLLHQYVGFALVALLVEINSIFLHLRQILLMANLMHTTCYRLNSIVNLGTYVVFRIATLAWMTRWLFLNRENVPPATYAVGTVGMAIMTPMNLILFYRLLRSDFFKSTQDVQREKEEYTLRGRSTLTELLGLSCGCRSWALRSREGAHGPGTGALLPLHLWMMRSDEQELLREASTALAAPRGTADMRREQKSTVSPLLFWTSKHHSSSSCFLVISLSISSFCAVWCFQGGALE